MASLKRSLGRSRPRPAAGRSAQRGQGLVEAVVVLPVFGLLLLGIFQAMLFYRAKAVVDYAALQAARSGSTNFAQSDAMRDGLVRGLLPLYALAPSNEDLSKAFAKAQLDVRTGAASIQIVSPTQAAFDDWKEAQYDGVPAIPNDSLPYRSAAPGSRSGMSVQDANVLKIRVTYRYPLIVPVIDRLVGQLDPARSLADHRSVYSLSVQSQAIVRMQTPIRDRSLLPDASGGGTSGSGDSGGGTGGSGGGTGGSGGDGGGSGDPGGPPGHVCI